MIQSDENEITHLALCESEERFRAVFAQAAVGIARVAPDGKWLEVNNRICEIVGYTKNELFELRFQDITHSEDLDTDLNYVRKIWQAKSTPTAWKNATFVRTKRLFG